MDPAFSGCPEKLIKQHKLLLISAKRDMGPNDALIKSISSNWYIL